MSKDMGNKKLKLGVLLEDFRVPHWQYKMLSDLKNSDFCDIDLVILNCNENKIIKNDTIAKKILANNIRLPSLILRKTLEFAYKKLIERKTHLPDCEKPMDSKPLFKDGSIIEVKTKRKKWSDYFYDEDIASIKNAELDIIIRAGFGILKGDILKAAKYGVWSFHHGDNSINRGGPAGFWESMEEWPETGSILQILNEDLDNGNILMRSFSCTNAISVRDNRNNYFWKTQSFMIRKIKELYLVGENEFFSRVEANNQHPTFYSERLYKKPTNLELFGLVSRKIIKKIKSSILNRLYFNQWILLFDIKSELSSSFWRYKKIVPPKDRFWADPFIMQKDGIFYIYIEEYIYNNKKGYISLITMDEHGAYSKPKKVLEKDYHLSYPFIFEYENETYMIPETMANNTVELYKCVEFPDKWEFEKNLFTDIKAVDSTVFHHDGKWWLFANCVETDGASSWDELYLFYSDSPLSSHWTPHPLNPVISDCKKSRPAGKVFTHNGNLYRPSQNCSVRYGYGFNINQIKTLNENEYEEICVSAIQPNWDNKLLGTHTFNREGKLHIIDAIYRQRKF